MCAEKSEGASYGTEALALGGLTETGPLLALFGHAGAANRCPLTEVKRKSYFRAGRTAFDPNVWSGRALQEVFVDLVVSGLASMYPASDWSFCSGPSWISARMRSH